MRKCVFAVGKRTTEMETDLPCLRTVGNLTELVGAKYLDLDIYLHVLTWTNTKREWTMLKSLLMEDHIMLEEQGKDAMLYPNPIGAIIIECGDIPERIDLHPERYVVHVREAQE